MIPISELKEDPPPPECAPGKPFDPWAVSPRPKPGNVPSGPPMERILKRGELVAGVDQNMHLFSTPNPHTGQLEGFDIEIVREIAEAIFGDRNKVKFRPVNFSTNFETLNKGEVDILAEGITITCERMYKEKILFSTVYLESGQKVMVPRRSPYDDITDLKGKKVCAPANTTSIEEIRKPEYGLEPVAVAEFSDCLVLLQQGQIDAISMTDSVLLGLQAMDPTMHIVGPQLITNPRGLAVRKEDEELMRFVNGVLQQMRDGGTWRDLYLRYMSELDPNIPSPPPAHYVD
jgi:polar amino acid transport system substrate-binding protein